MSPSPRLGSSSRGATSRLLDVVLKYIFFTLLQCTDLQHCIEGVRCILKEGCTIRIILPIYINTITLNRINNGKGGRMQNADCSVNYQLHELTLR